MEPTTYVLVMIIASEFLSAVFSLCRSDLRVTQE
jgi:hypothetical protein